jgi:hypothetical protein
MKSAQKQALEYIQTRYNMPWLKKGLRVKELYNGKEGVITGFGSGSYVQIKLFGHTNSNPYHPTNKLIYMDADGVVLGEYLD